MSDRPSVLVPVRILEGESIPEGIPELLANAHVHLLGYHVLPDQTAPGQARMQFEERASSRLDELAEMLEAAGGTVEKHLVFTHGEQKTIDRVTREEDCLAVLVPNATTVPEDILVAVRGTVGSGRLARLVAGLFAGTDVGVMLYHVAAEEETTEDAETLLEAVADQLVERGMDESAIDTSVARDTKPREALIDAAQEYDAVVMGETDPSVITFVFGMPAEQIAEQFFGPVLVVQRERESPEE